MSHMLPWGNDASQVLDAIGRSLAIIEFEPNGTILTANENFCRALGYELSEIKGKHHSLFVDPDEARGSGYAAFWKQLARGEYDAGAYRRIAKNGADVWIQASYNPVVGKGGVVKKIVKLASVITQEKLQAAENDGKLDAISRSQAVIEFTPDGQILTANENFLTVLGYRLDEIRGKHHRMFVGEEYARSDEYQTFWRKLAAGEFMAGDFRRFSKDGREIWIQASYNPIIGLNGKVMKVIKIATDLTDRMSALNQVGSGLGRLAKGDLAQHIETAFIPSLDSLRIDFNSSIETLRGALMRVGERAGSISSGASEIKVASDNLSERTEQQAASVEQTAAAVEELAATTKESAGRARDAGSLVAKVRASSEMTGGIVEQAVGAMRKIDDSSSQISAIIGVIDDIAFQTNLLALNAGVEAARAGEGGRGFAVVAREIRDLAQRAAVAAKEIKSLITASQTHVKAGVELVNEGGSAIAEMVGEIQQVDELVSSIVHSAQEQATTIAEVNSAIITIDKTTQQNAAMAEEATAASHNLADDARSLMDIMSLFQMGVSQQPVVRRTQRLSTAA